MKIGLGQLADGASPTRRCARSLPVLLLALIGCASPAPRPIAVASLPSAPSVALPVAPRAGRPSCPVVGNCVLLYRLADEVDDASTARLVAWMKAARDAGARAVVLGIDTPGGSVDAGFRIIDAIRSLHIPTHCVVEDRAYSMGFAILQACTSRLVTRGSKLMVHEAIIGPNRPGGRADPDTEAETLKAISRAMAEHCAARMRISVDEYHFRAAQDWWMDATDALKSGAVDRVVVSVESVRTHLAANLQLP